MAGAVAGAILLLRGGRAVGALLPATRAWASELVPEARTERGSAQLPWQPQAPPSRPGAAPRTLAAGTLHPGTQPKCRQQLSARVCEATTSRGTCRAGQPGVSTGQAVRQVGAVLVAGRWCPHTRWVNLPSGLAQPWVAEHGLACGQSLTSPLKTSLHLPDPSPDPVQPALSSRGATPCTINKRGRGQHSQQATPSSHAPHSSAPLETSSQAEPA